LVEIAMVAAVAMVAEVDLLPKGRGQDLPNHRNNIRSGRSDPLVVVHVVVVAARRATRSWTRQGQNVERREDLHPPKILLI
jgi:hypothetical protein